MNTIIEFAIYTIAGLALIAVPLALIAGAFASRSLNYSADADTDYPADDVRNIADDAHDGFTRTSNGRDQ